MAGKNNKNNFFSSNINKNGDNFLESMDPKSLRYSARKVFSDIAKNNIDYDQYWQYFTNSMFIDALIDVAYTHMSIHTTDANMYNIARQSIGSTADSEAILRYHTRLATAYTMIYNTFLSIRCNSYQVDIPSLKVLSNKLREYSRDLNDPIFSSNIMDPASAIITPSIPEPIDLMAPVEQKIKEPEYVTPKFTLKKEKKGGPVQWTQSLSKQ